MLSKYLRLYYLVGFVFVNLSCEKRNEKEIEQSFFPASKFETDEWAFYEGLWKAKDGHLEIELGLQSGAFGLEANYSLHEVFISETIAHGVNGNGRYSTTHNLANGQIGISLNGLSPWELGFLRYPETAFSKSEAMYFIARGNEELIPCDNKFNPLTNDWRYTLHRRSDLFTVEGYVTFEGDSALYYERNVKQRWILASLGKFNEIKAKYYEVKKEPMEGIYLKGLAYSVADSARGSQRRILVIKDIKDFNNDPD